MGTTSFELINKTPVSSLSTKIWDVTDCLEQEGNKSISLMMAWLDVGCTFMYLCLDTCLKETVTGDPK